MNRRGFLKGMAGILAAGVAPALIPSGILMPVRQLWTPSRNPLFAGELGNYGGISVKMQASADGILWTDIGAAGTILSDAEEMKWVIERPERYLRMVTTSFAGGACTMKVGA